MLAFSAGLDFRQEAAFWNTDQKRDWILRRLRISARRAYNHTVYYRELFDRIGFNPLADFSFEEFSRLPVLEPGDVRFAGANLVSKTVPPELLRKDSTGGSTGVPTEVWIGPEEAGWRESAVEWFMQRIGAPAGTRTAYLWGHHLDPVRNDNLRDRWYFFASNIRWFDCFRLSPEVLERYHRDFNRWQPACIVAYASALGNLATHVLEQRYRPSYPSQCLVTGGEKLEPWHREAISDAFNRPVYDRYGSRDVGCIGFQTDPETSLDHEIDWANLLVEPENAEEDSPILITKLHADGMPMLRYRVGDLARFPAGSRPGFPVFKLRQVLGRETDRIWLPDGRWIHGIQIPHLMKDYPIEEYMLLQRADYSVELKIVPKKSFRLDLHNGVIATLGANLPGVRLKLRIVGELPRTRSNKRRPVISEVEFRKRRSVS